MSDWIPRANEIFTAAVELLPEDRHTFVEQQCAGDVVLRAQVESLLNAHVAAGSFLAHPLVKARDLQIEAGGVQGDWEAEAPKCQSNGERIGAQIGPFKLLEEIGEGGFGVVYLAEQMEPLRRQVALKIIKPGMDTREVIARFEAERQALALMDHPSIAKVLDAGSTEPSLTPSGRGGTGGGEAGRPYFVMELVKGIPITEYCDQCSLTTRERLELFIGVCRAVQHAHQKGIIHRDIKPSNVLVAMQDGRPTSKIIDFGVAKALNQRLTDRTLQTRFTQILGTPMYMSPEQAELSPLEVDTRSDIYSLGVLLYELLTGTTPFQKERLSKASFDDLRRIIREEEPPRPSARISTLGTELTTIALRRHVEPHRLQQLVRGDLDWIVMKCLEKDRTRRYETANGLAREIQCYLDDEPVRARPPSAAYRLGKFARRNTGLLTAVAAIVTLLVTGTIVSIRQAVRATQAEELAEQRYISESLARSEADAASATARANEARAVTQAARANAVIELIQQMLVSASPYQARGQEYTVRQLLDDFSGSLGDELKDQPEVEATIHHLIGTTYAQLFVRDKADEHLRRAIELRRAVLGDLHPLVAESLIEYAWNSYVYRPAESVPAAEEAVSIYRTANDPRSLMRAVWVLHHTLFFVKKDNERADAVFEEAVAIADRFPDMRPPEFAAMVHNQAHSKWECGEMVEALSLAREAVELHRTLQGPEHPETGFGLKVLGRILMADGDYAGAEECFREALMIFRMHYDDAQADVVLVRNALRDVLIARDDQAGMHRLAEEFMDPTIDVSREAVVGAGMTSIPDGAVTEILRVGNETEVNGAVFAGSGDLIVSSQEGTPSVLVRETTTGQLVQEFGEYGHRDCRGIAVSKDGKTLAFPEDVQTGFVIHLHDLESGQHIRTLSGPLKHVTAMAFSPDCQLFASGSWKDTALRIWDLQTGNELQECSPPDPPKAPSEAWVLDAMFTSDGRHVLAAHMNAGVILWDVTSGDIVRRFEATDLQAVWTVALSPDDRLAASAGWDRIRLWDVDSGRQLQEWEAHADLVRSVRFSPDGRFLASGGHDRTLRFWDVASGEEVCRVESETHYPMYIDFCQDGRRLISGGGWKGTGDRAAHVWRLPEIIWPTDGQN